jgi:hypothetical protein
MTQNSFGDRVKAIAHALNTEFGGYTTAEYHTLLENKAVLIVLDDVWSLADIEPFRMGAGRSRLLYTSREGLNVPVLYLLDTNSISRLMRKDAAPGSMVWIGWWS